jgi:hypothetical protein
MATTMSPAWTPAASAAEFSCTVSIRGTVTVSPNVMNTPAKITMAKNEVGERTGHHNGSALP